MGSKAAAGGGGTEGDLIIAWMHSEHPNLAYLKEKIGRKRAECPSCLGILVGHKPLTMETPYLAQYQKFLLLEGWRLPTLAMIQDLGLNFYLTGHFEVHSVLMHEGVLHNRVTPAQRGFEEIFITYHPVSGSISNVDVSTH